jgi:hypothetical protein
MSYDMDDDYYGGDMDDMGFYPSYDKMQLAFEYADETFDNQIYEMMLDLMNMPDDYYEDMIYMMGELQDYMWGYQDADQFDTFM